MNRADPPDDVDRAALAAAVDRFVETFIADEMRPRAHKLLLSDRPKKRSKPGPGSQREEALQMLHAWVPASLQTELDRSAVAALVARDGAKPGVLLQRYRVDRHTIAEAIHHSDDAVFIGDDGALAILFAEVGPPTLCVRSRRR